MCVCTITIAAKTFLCAAVCKSPVCLRPPSFVDALPADALASQTPSRAKMVKPKEARSRRGFRLDLAGSSALGSLVVARVAKVATRAAGSAASSSSVPSVLRYFRFHSELPHPVPARRSYVERRQGSGWPEQCPPMQAASAFGWDVINPFEIQFDPGEDGWEIHGSVEVGGGDLEERGDIGAFDQDNCWQWDPNQVKPLPKPKARRKAGEGDVQDFSETKIRDPTSKKSAPLKRLAETDDSDDDRKRLRFDSLRDPTEIGRMKAIQSARNRRLQRPRKIRRQLSSDSDVTEPEIERASFNAPATGAQPTKIEPQQDDDSESEDDIGHRKIPFRLEYRRPPLNPDSFIRSIRQGQFVSPEERRILEPRLRELKAAEREQLKAAKAAEAAKMLEKQKQQEESQAATAPLTQVDTRLIVTQDEDMKREADVAAKDDKDGAQLADKDVAKLLSKGLSGYSSSERLASLIQQFEVSKTTVEDLGRRKMQPQFLMQQFGLALGEALAVLDLADPRTTSQKAAGIVARGAVKRNIAVLDLTQPLPPPPDPRTTSQKTEGIVAGGAVKRKIAVPDLTQPLPPTKYVKPAQSHDAGRKPITSTALVPEFAKPPKNRSRSIRRRSPTTRPARRRAIWQRAIAEKEREQWLRRRASLPLRLLEGSTVAVLPHRISPHVYPEIRNQAKVSTYLYLQTPPGWAVLMSDIPNLKRRFRILSALIDTDWYFPAHPWHAVVELPRTAAGKPIVLREGEPLCRLTPVKRGTYAARTLSAPEEFKKLYRGGQAWLQKNGRPSEDPEAEEGVLDIRGAYARQQQSPDFEVDTGACRASADRQALKEEEHRSA
eukprot:s7981_g3.t3